MVTFSDIYKPPIVELVLNYIKILLINKNIHLTYFPAEKSDMAFLNSLNQTFRKLSLLVLL